MPAAFSLFFLLLFPADSVVCWRENSHPHAHTFIPHSPDSTFPPKKQHPTADLD